MSDSNELPEFVSPYKWGDVIYGYVNGLDLSLHDKSSIRQKIAAEFAARELGRACIAAGLSLENIAEAARDYKINKMIRDSNNPDSME